MKQRKGTRQYSMVQKDYIVVNNTEFFTYLKQYILHLKILKLNELYWEVLNSFLFFLTHDFFYWPYWYPEFYEICYRNDYIQLA